MHSQRQPLNWYSIQSLSVRRFLLGFRPILSQVGWTPRNLVAKLGLQTLEQRSSPSESIGTLGLSVISPEIPGLLQLSDIAGESPSSPSNGVIGLANHDDNNSATGSAVSRPLDLPLIKTDGSGGGNLPVSRGDATQIFDSSETTSPGVVIASVTPPPGADGNVLADPTFVSGDSAISGIGVSSAESLSLGLSAGCSFSKSGVESSVSSTVAASSDPNALAVSGLNSADQPPPVAASPGISVTDKSPFQSPRTFQQTSSLKTPPALAPIVKTGPGFTDSSMKPETVAGIVEGKLFTKPLANFTSVTGAEYWEFKAEVDWGDGTSIEPAEVARTDTGFVVNGSHTYDDEADSRLIKIDVKGTDGSRYSTTLSIPVEDAPITDLPITEVDFPGPRVRNGVIGRFHSEDPNSRENEFLARIKWEATGSYENATVVGYGDGNFEVIGSHTYTELTGSTAQRTVDISVASAGGSSKEWKTNFNTGRYGNYTAEDHAVEFNATAGIPWAGELAYYSGFSPNDSTDMYFAQVDWGNGTDTSVSNQTKVQIKNVNGTLIVSGQHQYDRAGFYNPQIILRRVDYANGIFRFVTGSAVVVGTPIQLVIRQTQFTEGITFNGTVASFTTGIPNATPQNFQAAIDWGNGRVTAGAVEAAPNGNPGFVVKGQMLYADEFVLAASEESGVSRKLSVRVWNTSIGTTPSQNYYYSWATNLSGSFVLQAGGATAIADAPISIIDAPLSLVASQTLFTTNGRDYSVTYNSIIAGQRFETDNLISFNDGAFDPKSEFRAVIDWGDGYQETGNIFAEGDRILKTFNPNLERYPFDSWDASWGSSSITYGQSGRFHIPGSHIYANPGTYSVKITVNDLKSREEKSLAVAVKVISAYSPIVGLIPAPPNSTINTTFNAPIETTEGAVNEVIATFTDSYLTTWAHAAIIDWGDGTYSSKGVVAGSSFTGSHVYKESGDYAVKIWVKGGLEFDKYFPSSGAWGCSESITIHVGEAPVVSIALSGIVRDIDALRGRPMADQVLATITSQDPSIKASDFRARIAWGDGTSTENAQVIATPDDKNTASFQVIASHIYLHDGSMPLRVDVFDVKGVVLPAATANSITLPGGHSRTGLSLSGTVLVGEPPAKIIIPTQPISPIQFVAGAHSGNIPLATVVVDDPSEMSTYRALVYWGDGSSNTYSLTPDGLTGLKVVGDHTYSNPGKFRTLIVLSQMENMAYRPVTFSENEVTVASGSLILPQVTGPVSLMATPIGHVATDVIREGEDFNLDLGEMVVANDLLDATALRVVINWGDGQNSLGRLSQIPPMQGDLGRRYSLSGAHAFDRPGSFLISMTVDHGSQPGSNIPSLTAAWTSAIVMPPLLTAKGNALQVGAAVDGSASDFVNYYSPFGSNVPGGVKAGKDAYSWGAFNVGVTNSSVVAFKSSDHNEHDFTATISWGDGTISSGIVVGGNGTFRVIGSHEFLMPGKYRGEVTIVDSLATISEPFSTFVTEASAGIPSQIRGGQFQNLYSGSPITSRAISWGDSSPDINDQLYGTLPIAINYGVPSNSPGGLVEAWKDVGPYSPYFQDGTSFWAHHIYNQSGNQVVKSIISDHDAASISQKMISVSDAPLNIVMSRPYWRGKTGAAETSTIDDPLLFVFRSASVADTAEDFRVTMDQGDGTAPWSLVCVKMADGTFGVYGTPAYAKSGQYDLVLLVSRVRQAGPELAQPVDCLSTIIPARASDVPLDSAGVPMMPKVFSYGAKFEPNNVYVREGTNTTGVVLGYVMGLAGDPKDYHVPIRALNGGTYSSYMFATMRIEPGAHRWAVVADLNFEVGQWGRHEFEISIGTNIINQRCIVNVLTGWDASLVSRSDDPERAYQIALGPQAVSVNTGGLIAKHSLDFDLSPGTSVGGNPELVYNSATVAVHPVAELRIKGDFPRRVTAAKIWLDVNETDDPMTVLLGCQDGPATSAFDGQSGREGWTVRVPITVLPEASGVYPWKARVEIIMQDGSIIYQQIDGKAQVVVRDNPTNQSPFGSGWGISVLDHLSESSDGDILWVTGSGASRLFADNPDQQDGESHTYISPPEDFGVLKREAETGQFVYVSPDKTETRFDAKGRITSVRDRHGLTRSYKYGTDGRIEKITAPDGGETTFAFTDSTVSITYPGRANPVVLDTAGGVLNSIRDVDAKQSTRTFAYSAGRMTLDSWSPYSTSISYQGDTGRVSSITRGDSYWQFHSAIDSPATERIVKGVPTAIITEAIPDSTSFRKTELSTDTRGRILQEDVYEVGNRTELLSENRYVRNAAGDVTEARDSYDRPTKYEYSTSHEVTLITHADGSTENNTYDPQFHQLKSHTDERGNLTTYELNELGDVQKITDPLGNVTDYTFVSSTVGDAQVGLIQSKTDAKGVVETYTYDSHRRLLTTQQVIVQDSLLPATTGITTYAYDAAGNADSVSDPLGRVSVTTYDGRNQLTSRTDALAQFTEYEYFDNGLLLRVTDSFLSTDNPRRPVIQYEYDRRGMLTKTAEGDDSQFWRTSSRRYDSLGRLIEETSGNGTGVLPELIRRVTHQYDALDHETMTTTGNGDVNSVSSSKYDALGNLLSETDSNGVTTGYAYDAMDRRKRTREAVLPGTNSGWVYERYARQTVTAYDEAGNTVLRTVGESNRPDIAASKVVFTKLSYDALDRQTSRIDAFDTPNAVETITEYDSVGNVQSVTSDNAIGTAYTADTNAKVKTKYEYDGLHHRTKIIEAVGEQEETVTRLTYDQTGNLISKTSGISEINANKSHPSTTRYEYDGLNRQTRKTEAWSALDLAVNPLYGILSVGRVTTTQYDSQDRPISVTTGETSSAGYRKPVTTLTKYDPLGNVVKVTEAAGDSGNERFSTYNYNTAGLLILQITGQSDIAGYAKPISTKFDYDSLGRKTLEIEAPGTILARKTTLTYDGEGRLLTKTEGLPGWSLLPVGYSLPRIERHGYNDLGMENSVTVGYVGDQQHWRETATNYDSAGNKLSVFIGNFSGVNDGTRFNHFKLTNYQYDALGRVVSITEAPGTGIERTTSQSYDSAGNLIQSIRGDGENSKYAQPLATQYLYDHLGRRKQLIEDAGSWSVVDNKWKWSAQQLSDTLRRDTTWDYDAAGNLVTEVVGISASTEFNRSQKTSFQYDTLNRLTQKIEAADTPVARKATFVYDAADNLIEKTTGQSGSVTNPFGYAKPITTKSVYDALGRVSEVIEAAGSESARKSRFTYDAADNETSRETGISLVLTIPSNILRTETTYDLLNRPVTVSEAVGTPAMRYSTLDYDVFDRIRVRSTGLTFNNDARPLSTRYEYNAFDQPTLKEEAAGTWLKKQSSIAGVALTIWSWNPTAVNPVSRKTITNYDANGNAIEQQTGMSAVAAYQRLGQTATVFDALNRPVKTVEGSLNVDAENPGGDFRITLSGYDSANQVRLVTRYDATRYETPPSGVTAAQWQFLRTEQTKFNFDRLGRKTDVIYGFVTDEQRSSPSLTQGNFNDWYPDGVNSYVESFVYDANDNLIRSADPRGVVSSQDYDALNRPTNSKAAANVPVRLEDKKGYGWVSPVIRQVYDSQDRVVVSVDPMNVATYREFDALGRLASLSEGGIWGNGLFSLRPEGRLSNFAYDAAGNKILQRIGLGADSQTIPGVVATYQYARPETTTYSYDPLGRRTAMTQAAGTGEAAGLGHNAPVTSWKYDSAGNVIRINTPLTQTDLAYDDLSRSTVIKEGSNEPGRQRVTTSKYDSANNVIQTVDGNNVPHSMEYDTLNRLLKTKDGPAGKSIQTTLTYDLFGLATKTTVEAGTEKYYHDRQGRLVWTKTTTSHWILNRYDLAGNRVALEDWVKPSYYPTPTTRNPNPTPVAGNWRKLITTYEYDPLNREIKSTSPTNRQVNTSYDAIGHVISISEWYSLPDHPIFGTPSMPKQRVRDFEYDALGRRTVEKWSIGNGFLSAVQKYRYVFDALGNQLLSCQNVNADSDRDGIIAENSRDRIYDALNRVRANQTVIATLSYTYDADSRLTVVDDNVARVTTNFDAAGRIRYRQWSTSGLPEKAEFGYKPTTSGLTDLVSSISYSRAGQSFPPVCLALQYDTLGREVERKYTQQTSSSANSTIIREQIATTYKSGTNLVATESRTGDKTYENTRTLEYRNSQVTKETNTSSYIPEDQRVLKYTLDDDGNAVYATAAEASDSSSGNRAKKSGNYQNYYDSAGNIVLQVDGNIIRRVDYDIANRVIRVQVCKSVLAVVNIEQDIQYEYDAEGNLIRRVAKKSNGIFVEDEYKQFLPLDESTEVTYYAYDGLDVWSDLDASKKVLSRYVQGPKPDQLLARQDPGTSKTYLYMTDRQNTVTGILDSEGSWQKAIMYKGTSPFSRYDWTGGTFHDRFEYTGRPVDFRTGLQNNRARWLDLEAGRWMSEDPLGFNAGDTNLYRYVGGSYANATDPSGLEAYLNASSLPWNARNHELRAAEIKANAGEHSSEMLLTAGGAVNGLLLGAPEQILDWSGRGPSTWSPMDRLKWRIGDALGTTGSFFLGYGEVMAPLQVARLSRMANLARSYRIITTGRAVENYSEWSIRNQDSAFALNSEAAEWTRLGGLAVKTYGSAQLFAGPLGALTGFSRTARMAVPVVGLGLLGNDVRRAGKDLFDSELPWPRRLEKAVELAAGLQGGYSKRGLTNFARGQSAGEWASGNTRFGRWFGDLEQRAIQRSLDVAIHKGLGSLSNSLHERASFWANQRGYKVCFAAGTKLLAKGEWGEGWRAIELITTNDFVASRDEHNQTGLVEWKAVEELFQRTAPVMSLCVNGQVIRTTAEHPFYHEEKGWTPAGELEVGDRLVGHHGELVIVNQVAAGGGGRGGL